MLYINGNTIRMTRGDTAYLTFPLKTSTGEEYTMQTDDVLTFSVKETIEDDEYILQKSITGSNTIHIEPQDTTYLSIGKYEYDIQLNMASGDVFTPIEVSTFELLPEVTR